MIEATCAFTGHRPKSFPWKYDETAPGCVLLKEALAAQIKALSDRGVTDFLSGMAQGTGLWCSQIVLDIKKKNPALRLHCVLPCEGQADNWPASAQERYFSILERADRVMYVCREYHKGCMLERNRYLVDHAICLLVVYNGNWRGGTAMTVRYAQKLRRKIIILFPTTKCAILLCCTSYIKCWSVDEFYCFQIKIWKNLYRKSSIGINNYLSIFH